MEIWASGIFIFLYIVIGLCVLYCWIRIVMKAEYTWAYGLLFLIPAVDLVLFIVFAFETWPIQARLTKLRKQSKSPLIASHSPEVIPQASSEPKPVEIKPATNFCSSCGNRLILGVRYCSNCGSKIGQKV